MWLQLSKDRPVGSRQDERGAEINGFAELEDTMIPSVSDCERGRL
jgi:hypothetical protein